MNAPLQTSAPCTILVVEDSPLIRQRVIERLTDSLPDARIDGADCVPDAVDHLATCMEPDPDEQDLTPHASHYFHTTTRFPDVIVLDLDMPGPNGMNLLRAVKREHPEVGVIIYSCYSSASVRTACLTMGADAFVSKNDDLEVLEAAVKTLAAPRRFTAAL